MANNDFQKYTELKRIVSYYLDEQGKSGGDFDQCWILAFRALIDLEQDISAEPISVRLPVMENKTVQIPANCMAWSKIGLLNNKGEVVCLKINNGLSIFKDRNPNRLSQLTPDVRNGFNSLLGLNYFLNWFDDGLYFNLFGVGGGMVAYGECRVDDRAGVIVLNEHFRYDHIILEMLVSPEENGEYRVQTALQEAIIAFISWKKKTGPREEYYGAKREARGRLAGKRVILSKINDVLRQPNGQFLRS